MLIIIPSYKRTDILTLVIKSVLRCDVSDISERKKIIVANNYYPNREIVDSIVSQFGADPNFICTALHRTETMVAIDNWFSAIAEHAFENEVVFLLGDDDLMMPWGLRDRYREIVKNGADMLLSDFADRIYFFNNGRKYWLSGSFPREEQQEKTAHSWEFYPADHPEASFMSNHCYRNSAGFRKGLEVALAWCDSQHWLDRGVRTSMLPFYLPYTISVSGGTVVSLRSKCVFRGAIADEAIKSSYAAGGNTTFYNLCAYDTFANRSLQMDEVRLARVCSMWRLPIIRGYLTMIFDKEVPLPILTQTFNHSGLKKRDLVSPHILRGAVQVGVRLLGLRGLRLRIKRRSKTLLDSDKYFEMA